MWKNFLKCVAQVIFSCLPCRVTHLACWFHICMLWFLLSSPNSSFSVQNSSAPTEGDDVGKKDASLSFSSVERKGMFRKKPTERISEWCVFSISRSM